MDHSTGRRGLTAAFLSLLILIQIFSQRTFAQQNVLIGVWIARVPAPTGIGGQAYVQFFPNGIFNRMILVPRGFGGAPAACQIGNGRWIAGASGQSLIVHYIVDDYEPKQCLQVPGSPMVACEPPPPDFRKEIAVRMEFQNYNAMAQYNNDGSIIFYTRALGFPPISAYCRDAR